ncbi:DUF4142 domain-containing protein [Algoriphagus vanfongensis]|uniref:DUF4142 domain-containing protein n=1 Tax=Algoriphagus vanfongensis TaxID=426371 RepID=UPI000A07A9F7|nr:DUF4142 domain-containing protein [Algoriphagus vanfongensis]
MKKLTVLNRATSQIKRKARISGMLLLSAFAVAGFTACENEDDEPIVDTINEQDRNFAIAVSQSFNGQIALGQLASVKGQDDSVQEYATMISEDHGEAMIELTGIVDGKDVEISGEVLPEIQSEIDRLSELSDEEFDMEFINSQQEINDNLRSALANEVDNGENYLLKSFASKVDDVIKKHNTEADLVEAEIKIEDI